MKKFFLGTALGVTLGILGYKTYKNHEEEVNEFLDELLNKDDYYDYDEDDDYDYGYYEDDDYDLSNVDIEELKSLKDEIEETLENKERELNNQKDEIILDVSSNDYVSESEKAE